MGDGSQIFDQVGLIHPDSEVLDRQSSGLIIGLDVDFERQVFIEDAITPQLNVPEFFKGVRRVGDELAKEDLLVRLEAVDDDVEDLTDLGLEGMLFNDCFAHGCKGYGFAWVFHPRGKSP